MSGSPGTGSIVRTSWPSSMKTCRSRAHWRIAVAASIGTSGRIHGLIAYVTAKCSGGHIRYRRAVACLPWLPPSFMSPG